MKPEGADERRGDQRAEKHEDGERDGHRMAPSRFKNSDALVVVDGVLQDADRFPPGER